MWKAANFFELQISWKIESKTVPHRRQKTFTSFEFLTFETNFPETGCFGPYVLQTGAFLSLFRFHWPFYSCSRASITHSPISLSCVIQRFFFIGVTMYSYPQVKISGGRHEKISHCTDRKPSKNGFLFAKLVRNCFHRKTKDFENRFWKNSHHSLALSVGNFRK